MTPDQLEQLSRRFFGKRWRKALCERFDYEKTTIFFWTSGRKPVPRFVERDLLNLYRERQLERIARGVGRQSAPRVRKPKKPKESKKPRRRQGSIAKPVYKAR